MTDLPPYSPFRKEQWKTDVKDNAKPDKDLLNYLWLKHRFGFEAMVSWAMEYDVADLQR